MSDITFTCPWLSTKWQAGETPRGKRAACGRTTNDYGTLHRPVPKHTHAI